MILEFNLDNKRYAVNTQQGHDLSIPLHFDGQQVNHFGAQSATATAMRSGDFIGNTRLGGSCNANDLSINPHCHGTHTETLSHIIDALHAPSAVLTDRLLPCALISIAPSPAVDTDETYQPTLEKSDQIITAVALQKALNHVSEAFASCLLIRTLPNDDSKQTRRYSATNQAPFFTSEAMALLVEQQVQHLLVDIPSVDRFNDEGLLHNHHQFWQVTSGVRHICPTSRVNATITELIYINSTISDGNYLLNLGLPRLQTDAVPSSPILYPLELL